MSQSFEFAPLSLAQLRDEIIIEGQRFEEVDDQRRKRSLKFRAKQRAMRAKMFNDPFYKQDRSQKNLNKVVAAKRRKRDGTGKFNFEANMQQSDNIVNAAQGLMPTSPEPSQDESL